LTEEKSPLPPLPSIFVFIMKLPIDDDDIFVDEIEGLVESFDSYEENPNSYSSSPSSSSRAANYKIRRLRNDGLSPRGGRVAAEGYCRGRRSKCWVFTLLLISIGMAVYIHKYDKEEGIIVEADKSHNDHNMNMNDDNNPGSKNDSKLPVEPSPGDDYYDDDDDDDDDDDHVPDDDDIYYADDDYADKDKEVEVDDDATASQEDDDDDDDYNDDGDTNNTDIEEQNADVNDNIEENPQDFDDNIESKPQVDNTEIETQTNETKVDQNANVDDTFESEPKHDDETVEEEQTNETVEDNGTEILTEDDDDDEDDEAIKDALIEKWGHWHFWDGTPEIRPTEDYLSMYPNKDCPYEGFPSESWQADAVYVNHMIDSASELVIRAKDAIFTEYGLGPREEISRDQLIQRTNMFKLDFLNLNSDDVSEPVNEGLTRGGWTTSSSFEGLARRLTHAMMTRDTFTVVMGGNGAAAGHGNHHLQSYMMQFHQIMEPLLERVGVKLITKSIANDGLGTIQNTLGSVSIYGDDIDVIIWDADPEVENDASVELFFRQALLAGSRRPVLFAPKGKFDVLKNLHNNVDADVFGIGSAMHGIPETLDEEQVKDLPYFARYLNCPEDKESLCLNNPDKYKVRCWIDRDDVTPPTQQLKSPSDQSLENPGFRQHQLKGRVITFIILEALQDALDNWSDITIVEGQPLDGDFWHLTNYYENIESKIKSFDTSVGNCGELKDFIPERICSTPLQGRTEFTPRSNPSENSITSILKATPDGYVPTLSDQMLYEGPDVPNPDLKVPKGEIDVRAIVINRRRELQRREKDYFNFKIHHEIMDTNEKSKVEKTYIPQSNLRRRTDSNEIIPGKGWELQTLPGNCDGTATGICGRQPSSNCLLYDKMDEKGGLIGNALSGWLVMNVSNMTQGIVILKLETGLKSDDNQITKDWNEVNNGEYTGFLQNEAPGDFMFDFVINNVVTTLTQEEFSQRKKSPNDEVELLTLLDDPDFVPEGESKDVEVAIRLRNCDHDCTLKLTHVYWA